MMVWAASGSKVPVTWTYRNGNDQWFGTPSLIAEDTGATVRVKISRSNLDETLTLLNSKPKFSDTSKVQLGDVHMVGPLEIESPSRGYDRSFASQQEDFRSDEVFRYLDRPYRWQHRGDWQQAIEHRVPTIPDRPSVTVLHQSLESPGEKSIDLLLSTDDGYVVYLNGKEIVKEDRSLSRPPLSQRHVLRLQPGHNDLYLKLVNHYGQSNFNYAFASPWVDVPTSIADLVKKFHNPKRKRGIGGDTQADRDLLRFYFRYVQCDHPDWQVLVDSEIGLRRSRQKLLDEMPTSLVWKERQPPRRAFVLDRGQYDQPGERARRGTPDCLPPLPGDAPPDRLGLATWLTASDHPLTARVAVNRFWQAIFGVGLVQTSEDFGVQGTPPSHPVLLDFLAADFQHHDWDVKRLIKTIVMTDAYRRDAKVLPDMQKIDPNNEWLARGPRQRLDAEVLRDQALSLSGQLRDDLGGPSVKPPQPAGLWEAVGYTDSNTAHFQADVGDEIFRRSVYVFWKRTSPPPQLSTFDAPSRESCTAVRERTNTPMQALLLMNETQQVDAARKIAQRYSSGGNDSDQLARLFEQVTARVPTKMEQTELKNLLVDLQKLYQSNLDQAEQLVGDPDAIWAAWTMVASTLLNLDEVVSK